MLTENLNNINDFFTVGYRFVKRFRNLKLNSANACVIGWLFISTAFMESF